jgi:hypothetical protein
MLPKRKSEVPRKTPRKPLPEGKWSGGDDVRQRKPLMSGIVWWTGVAAGGAGVVAAYSEHWLVAVGFGLLAFVCAVIVGRPGE